MWSEQPKVQAGENWKWSGGKAQPKLDPGLISKAVKILAEPKVLTFNMLLENCFAF